VNPTSATRLKMAGGGGEEEATERLGKPASGTVVDGLGTVDESGETREIVGETRRYVDSPLRER